MTAEDQRALPRDGEQHAEKGRDALAALEVEPDRKEMPKNAPTPATQRRRRGRTTTT